MTTEQLTGLQLAMKLIAQIGNDDSDRAIVAVHDLADEHAQRLTLQQLCADQVWRIADLEVERNELIDQRLTLDRANRLLVKRIADLETKCDTLKKLRDAATDERDALRVKVYDLERAAVKRREISDEVEAELVDECDTLRTLERRAESERDELRARLAEMNSSYAHDAVWEALQRMIEDGQTKGPASREDALTVARHRDRVRLLAASPVPAQAVPDVDALAQYIRSIDGQNSLGAGALAERIVEWMEAPEHKA